MPAQRIGNSLGVAACNPPAGGTNRSNLNGSPSTFLGELGDTDHYDNIYDMMLFLVLADGGWFTAARLATMTYNDLVYACRVYYHPNTITPRT